MSEESLQVNEQFAFDVFLSHSSKDKATVRPLAERLRQDGLRVWFDEWALKPGDNIPAKIEEGLEHSRILLLFMSANAFGSDWAQLEAGTFRFRDPLNKERRFIPLRIDKTPIRGSLAQLLYLDLVSVAHELAYAKLLAACRPERGLFSPDQHQEREQLLESIHSLGHTDTVRSVAWNPDGQSALSGADDNTVRLWEITSGRCLRVLEGHTGGINSVAWSPDGQCALSGADDRIVRLWDITSGRCLRVLEGHTDRVRSVAWSPDGKRALSGADDRIVRLWDIASGRCLRVLEGHISGINSVAWSPDGKRALSGADDRTVRLWDIASGRCLRVLRRHTDRVWSVAWSPNGQFALSGSSDTTVRLWEIASGYCLRTFIGHTDRVWSVAWSPDGQFALSGADDETVRLWEITSGRCLRVLEGHTGGINSVDWGPDGRRALSGAFDMTVRLWEIASGCCLRVNEGHTDTVRSVAWSPDGKRVLSGADDTTVRLWEIASGRCLRVLEGHTGGINSVAWSPDGKRALSGADDTNVRLWDIASGRCLRTLKGHTDRVWSVAWSPDGKRALSGADDNTVLLWDIAPGRCLRVLGEHTDTVRSVAWSPDGKRALSGADDRTVRLWDIASGRCLRVLEGHTGSINSVVWSPDGQRALSGSSDTTVRLWDVASGRCLRVLEGHTGCIDSVAWSPNGQCALSGSSDTTVRLWEIASGRCLRVLEGHTGGIDSVAWSPDGQCVHTGAHNGVMRNWRISLAILPSPSEAGSPTATHADDSVEYTNAKILLIGETNAGKTGMTERLVHDRAPSTRTSTSGVWSTQYPLAGLPQPPGREHELWLWDFGGQADQRLVHQLYLDHTALVLLMFDGAKETVLPELRDWQRALSRSKASQAPTFLIAGRTDVGCRFDRDRVRAFAAENSYRYFETSAETNHGVPEMRRAMLEGIPWDKLEARTSPAVFKQLKTEIMKLRDEGLVLVTFKELEACLRLRLPATAYFTAAQLAAVVTLLDGPGVVKALDTGTHILLRPEWINIYAQAVIRTLRANDPALGCLDVNCIARGKLLFQSRLDDGRVSDNRRLPPEEEKVVLQVMEAMLEERGLCLRQGGELIFPSYFGLERPAGPVPPKFFASYTFGGFLDDIYASLVVRLAHCGAYRLAKLWRDAADFETVGDGGLVGVKLLRLEDGRGELLAHHSKGVSQSGQGQRPACCGNWLT